MHPLLEEIHSLYHNALNDAENIISEYQRKKARELLREVLLIMAPPPDMTGSEWADEHVWLSSELSAKPGQWRTDERPFLRGIMDAETDPRIQMITVQKASRMGITMCINNIIGRHAHLDPCPIIYAQQTLGEVKKYGVKIFTPYIEATPVLRGLFPPAKSRQQGNTLFEKSFPGGSLTLVGGNVSTGFRMIIARIVVGDDIDGFEWTVGKEGDPIGLLMHRTDGVWNKKIILVSKPTIKGFSQIDNYFEKSDKRFFHVPCSQCGHKQILRFGGKDLDYGIKWKDRDPATAYYLCESCHGVIRDFHRREMNLKGEWRPTAISPGHAGFGGLSQLYHSDITFAEIVDDFLKSKDNPEQLQVFVNDRLGMPYEDKGTGMDENVLFNRREAYGPELPEGVVVLLAAVDVHDEWLAVKVVGVGRGGEMWVIEYLTLHGDTLLPEVWEALDKYLLQTWKHPAEIEMHISVTAIDSGHRDEMVSAFVRNRLRSGRNIIAIKGDDRTKTSQIMSELPPTKKNKYKVHIYIVNVTRAKISVFGRLKIQNPGPAYIHFPMTCDKTYFEGLLSERWVPVRRGNITVRVLAKKPGVRNEPLDLMGYILAGLEWLQKHRRFDLDTLADMMLERMKEVKTRQTEGVEQGAENNIEQQQSGQRRIEKIHKGNWVTNWRGKR